MSGSLLFKSLAIGNVRKNISTVDIIFTWLVEGGYLGILGFFPND